MQHVVDLVAAGFTRELGPLPMAIAGVRQQELIRGAAMNSQADNATSREYDTKALLLQSQFDFFAAHDEVVHAIGGTLQ
jgi:hypothetical protein